MKYILGLITAVGQFIVGYFVLIAGGFGLAMLVNAFGWVGPENTNPWWNTPSQFIFFVLSSSFGVWVVGLLAGKLRKIDFNARKLWWGLRLVRRSASPLLQSFISSKERWDSCPFCLH